MQAPRIPKDGTVGMFCPSQVADMDRYAQIIGTLERLGFRVKLGMNFQKDSFGYAASAAERAADLNALVADESVHMILFSGGEGAAEVLPLIDYENIRRHPKLFSSYSDGTSILNAIRAQTGLTTYYGIGAGNFADLRYYTYTQFCAHFVEGYETARFVSDSTWRTLCGGVCEGELTGGYLSLFALMLGSRYFSYDPAQKYILFAEDHERFSTAGMVSEYIAFLGQSPFMKNIAGLIFGHYAESVPDPLLRCLERFGNEHGIPAVYTDDFGHGIKHAVLPIGVNARLDANRRELIFTDF